MRPVKQSILHDPANGKYGDCLSACIASLLELPIEEMPHFCDGPRPVNWQRDLNAWLALRGLAFIEFGVGNSAEVMQTIGVDVYHTISGRSSRFPAEAHCVIGRNGAVVFDPSPDDLGIAGEPESFGYLIRTCGMSTAPSDA